MAEAKSRQEKTAARKAKNAARRKPTTRTDHADGDVEDPYADLAARSGSGFEPPAEGADHPNPYAHLPGATGALPGDEKEGE